MRGLVWTSLVVGLVAGGSLSPASADEDDSAAPAEEAASAEAEERSAIEQARDHMEEGQAFYLQGRFQEAAAEFEAAYAAEPFSAFLYNAGVALERAGEIGRAADFFEQYLERDPSASDRRAVQERIDQLRAALEPPPTPPPADPDDPDAPPPQVAEAPPAPELPEPTAGDFKSLLSVRTNPEGAQIRVSQADETVAEGPAPFAHTLDQGRFLVTVEHPDYQTVEQEVRIDPGKVYVVIVEMSQGEFLGYLRVVSNVAGARVFIDDQEGPAGQTPFGAPIPVGPHHVRLERPGYGTEETEAEVNIGEDVTVRIDMTRVDFGRLRVTGNRGGARVLVDGERVGDVPYRGQLPAGEHRVVIADGGFKNFEENVVIRQGQETPIQFRLRPAVDRSGAVVTTTFAALFLGGGIALSVVSNNLLNDIRNDRDNGVLASDDARIDRGLYLSIGANASYGLALILGLIALYQFLHDPLPPSEGTVLEPRDWTDDLALLPSVDPERQALGLSLSGRL